MHDTHGLDRPFDNTDPASMELRQLRAFVETAQAGSITAAAKVLHATQPALSRQIKALEGELGVTLFERGAHSITLTPAGEALHSEASKLLKFCDQMVQRVKALEASEPLRIGYSPSLTSDFLSIAIERFTQLHPRVSITLRDCSTAEMHNGVVENKLDLIVTVPCPRDHIRWEALRQIGWAVLLPATHPYTSKAAIDPSDLEGQRLLLFDREHYPDYWEKVTAYFKDLGIQAKVAGEFDGIGSLTAAVEAGLGIALVAETSRVDRSADARVAVRAMSQPIPETFVSVGLLAKPEAPRHVLAFVEELKAAAKS